MVQKGLKLQPSMRVTAEQPRLYVGARPALPQTAHLRLRGSPAFSRGMKGKVRGDGLPAPGEYPGSQSLSRGGVRGSPVSSSMRCGIGWDHQVGAV